MLNKIHLEKWNELKIMGGTAEHVPEAILNLLSEDENEFEAAYWKLENHVVVQGDLYDSATVIPKYLEAVIIKAKFKPGVLELLFQIGNGASNNKTIENTCYNEVVSTLKRLLTHPDIIETNIATLIQNDLNDLVELHNEKNNVT